MIVLLIIDYQNDYCEGGIMTYPNTLEKIPIINRIRHKYDMVIFTQNIYPPNHNSFIGFGGKQKPHCIRNTKGADINDNFLMSKSDKYITKNTYSLYTSPSAFYDAKDIRKKTRLDVLLTNATELHICGVGLETTIFSTIIDCCRFGIKCKLLIDCVCHNVDESAYDKLMTFVKSLKTDIIHSSDIE